eukprot:CAMPEP_0174358992 /NCGR_PEP_ID=MMETSP0811_2-20130205/45807_1 /TAXON_ID=73025 ORGANISM="Eutreptiella gymnastica-like, Strain CCMP1594" /NCGR_SAMPLE_ID=MMETSP0811_2 /ASSEMBLY_ACC=CAM_ASM_000667 /LENGTH=40 /DNA_ID= /DNA_START= /DNA_END= /DNA_ORIENTATION=
MSSPVTDLMAATLANSEPKSIPIKALEASSWKQKSSAKNN